METEASCYVKKKKKKQTNRMGKKGHNWTIWQSSVTEEKSWLSHHFIKKDKMRFLLQEKYSALAMYVYYWELKCWTTLDWKKYNNSVR